MAAAAADNATEDLTGTLWRDDEWLKCAPVEWTRSTRFLQSVNSRLLTACPEQRRLCAGTTR